LKEIINKMKASEGWKDKTNNAYECSSKVESETSYHYMPLENRKIALKGGTLIGRHPSW